MADEGVQVLCARTIQAQSALLFCAPVQLVVEAKWSSSTALMTRGKQEPIAGTEHQSPAIARLPV